MYTCARARMHALEYTKRIINIFIFIKILHLKNQLRIAISEIITSIKVVIIKSKTETLPVFFTSILTYYIKEMKYLRKNTFE